MADPEAKPIKNVATDAPEPSGSPQPGVQTTHDLHANTEIVNPPTPPPDPPAEVPAPERSED